MPIIWDGTFITITGYTEALPCGLEDVYQADLAGGWGVVTRPTTGVYRFHCRVKIGNGSTPSWFKMVEQTWIFTLPFTGYNQHRVYVYIQGHVTIGAIANILTKSTYLGCSVIDAASDPGYYGAMIVGETGSVIYFYGSSFRSTGAGAHHLSPDRAWNCHFGNSAYQLGNMKIGDFYNCVFSSIAAGWYYWHPSTSIVHCSVNGASFLAYLENGTVLRDVWARNYGSIYPWGLGPAGTNAYLIDCDLGIWTITTPAYSGTIHRQYSLDVRVLRPTVRTDYPIDEITESLSPTGTDGGLGTWDGDWSTNGAGILLDNVKFVVGTGSIKGNDLDYAQYLRYSPDGARMINFNAYDYSSIKFWVYAEDVDRIRLYWYVDNGGHDYEINVSVTPNAWNFVEVPISPTMDGWNYSGSGTPILPTVMYYMIFLSFSTGAATVDKDLWVDGFYFSDEDMYGLEGATVTVKDKDGTVLFSQTTNRNGRITTQTVTFSLYKQAVLELRGPHTLIISKNGYRQYQGVLTINAKTSLRITLPEDGGGAVGPVVEGVDAPTVIAATVPAAVEAAE
jgi:hypothetical protein